MACRRHAILSLVLAALLAGQAQAQVFYSQTVVNPLLGGDPGFSGFPALDDVQIEESDNPFHLPIAVTKVTYGIVQGAGATATTLNGYYSTVSPDADNDGFAELDVPVTSFGTAAIPANALQEIVVYNAVIEDGGNPLFTVIPNFGAFDGDFGGLFDGKGIFAVGMDFADDGTDNFWGAADYDAHVYTNADFAWGYDNELGEASVFSFPETYTVFLLTIEGHLVPEPASAGLLATAGLALLGRRRRVV